MCSALTCRQQRRTAPTYSGLSFGCCVCPIQAPNAVSSALSSSRWVLSPSPVSKPRIAWLVPTDMCRTMEEGRKQLYSGFFHHMQWYSQLPFLLQCGAALFPPGSSSSVEQLWPVCHRLCRTLGSFILLTVAVQIGVNPMDGAPCLVTDLLENRCLLSMFPSAAAPQQHNSGLLLIQILIWSFLWT